MAFFQSVGCCTAHKKCPLYIKGKYIIEILAFHTVEVFMIDKVRSSCIIYKNVKLSEIFYYIRYHCLALIVVGHVSLINATFYTESLDLGFSLKSFLFGMSIVYADVCTFLCKTESYSFSYAGTAACYKSYFFFDIHFICLLIN